MSNNVENLTDANFEARVKTGVTLVDFWATWCPPCRAQGPIIEKIAGAFSGSALIAKVDVDSNANTASMFGVSSIPTLILMKDGKEISRFVGLQQEAALTKALNSALGK